LWWSGLRLDAGTKGLAWSSASKGALTMPMQNPNRTPLIAAAMQLAAAVIQLLNKHWPF